MSKGKVSFLLVLVAFVLYYVVYDTSIFMDQLLEMTNNTGVNISTGNKSISSRWSPRDEEVDNYELPKECDSVLERKFNWFSLSKYNALNIKRYGKFVELENEKLRANYDHNSCFVMKARYNCALPHNSENLTTDDVVANTAEDYQLVFVNNKNENESRRGKQCNIRQVVSDAGGIDSLWHQLAKKKERRQRKNLSSHFLFKRAENNDEDVVVNIAMFGNSFLRQIWESLTCTYRHDITNITLQIGGPDISMAATRKRNGKKVDPTGSLVTIVPESNKQGIIDGSNNNPPPLGCRNNKDRPLKSFYYDGVEVSNNLISNECNDEIAVVEFKNRLRFYFFFRPYQYKDMNAVLDMVGLNVNDIDFQVINDYLNNQGALFHILNIGKNLLKVDMLVPILRHLQNRDLNKWFGATNPFISNPPDNHPCMPGIPEDEVALMLFSLLFDVQLELY